MSDFQLGYDETGIIAVKHVDLPDSSCKLLAVPGFLDQRAFAQEIEQRCGIRDRNGVFKFQPRDAANRALDSQKGLLACDPDADHSFLGA